MDAGIILSGVQPNFVNALSGGVQAGQQMRQAQQQNALADLYRTQGAGILSGDQGAINALAQISPQTAFDIQGSRQQMDARALDMQATRQRMDYLTREEARQAAEYAATKTAAERAAEAAQIEDAVKMGMMIQSPEQWDQVMATQAPDLVGQFANRDALAGKYMTMAEILKQSRPDQMAAGDRFKVVGSQLVDLAAPGGPKPVMTAPGQEEVIYGPDGRPILSRGPVGSSAKFTESQSKDVTYSTRARGALEGLDPVAGALTDRTDQIAERVPLGFGKEFQTNDFQLAKQYGDEFLQAILRKDTGAAITAQEQELYGQTYLPQPGDSQDRLTAKAEARQRAVLAMEAGMSPEQIIAQERALQANGRGGKTDIPRVQIDGFTIEALD